MSHLLHPSVVQGQLRFCEDGLPDSETYRTNLNHPQHSKSPSQRLTLVMLWFLRVPPMVRIAVIAVLVIPFLASSSGAAGKAPVRNPSHADLDASATHRAHRSTSPSSRVARTSSRRSGTSKSKRASQSGSRRTATHSGRSSSRPSVSSASRRSFSSSSRRSFSSARVRRTGYAHSQSNAHFVPVASVPVPKPAREQAVSATDSADPIAANFTDRRAGEAARLGQSSSPDSPSQSSVPESDEAPEPADASRPVAGNGNPLEEPPATQSSPASAGTVEIAGLNVPRVYGRYALRGTRDSLIRQNERSEQEYLERIEDDSDLEDRIARGQLIRVPESAGLLVNPALPENRRYCRPWTADFLSDLSRAYEAKFHRPLVVSSAVRTVEYQKRLMRINRNAADAEGDVVSPHLTGATIDIAKSGLSRTQMQWMRDHLFAYQTAGVIDVEEEFRQRCFHITVYKSYAPASAPGKPHHAPVPQTLPPDPSSATITDDAASRNE
jgi:Family of unknown function (DUF5715)